MTLEGNHHHRSQSMYCFEAQELVQREQGSAQVAAWVD